MKCLQERCYGLCFPKGPWGKSGRPWQRSARVSLGKKPRRSGWATSLGPVRSHSSPLCFRDLPSGPHTEGRKQRLFYLCIYFTAKTKGWSRFRLLRRPAPPGKSNAPCWRVGRLGDARARHPATGSGSTALGRAWACLPLSHRQGPRVWAGRRVAASPIPDESRKQGSKPRTHLNCCNSRHLRKQALPPPTKPGFLSSGCRGASHLTLD